MISYCHSRHIFDFGLLDELFDDGGTIEKAIFGVQVQRYVRSRAHELLRQRAVSGTYARNISQTRAAYLRLYLSANLVGG
jgi:hypothetical protein